MKKRFIALLENTRREGIDELLKYLAAETDFYTAPASTKYHGCYDGGLLEHSLRVYDNIVLISSMFGVNVNQDTLVITALLHDICKANLYKKTFRNRKNEDTGQWEKYETYDIEDQFPIGHGEKSVILLQNFISLTTEEMLAIRWHMGGFDDAGRSWAGGMSLSAAMNKTSLICVLHMADLASSHIDKV